MLPHTVIEADEMEGKAQAIPSQELVASIERGIADAEAGRSEEDSIVLSRLHTGAVQARARRTCRSRKTDAG